MPSYPECLLYTDSSFSGGKQTDTDFVCHLHMTLYMSRMLIRLYGAGHCTCCTSHHYFDHGCYSMTWLGTTGILYTELSRLVYFPTLQESVVMFFLLEVMIKDQQWCHDNIRSNQWLS